jgi:hypothetical protein
VPLIERMAAAESRSRRSRCRSDLISAADWYRRSRSFSIALPMMRASSGGTAGLIVTGEGGVPLRIWL